MKNPFRSLEGGLTIKGLIISVVIVSLLGLAILTLPEEQGEDPKVVELKNAVYKLYLENLENNASRMLWMPGDTVWNIEYEEYEFDSEKDYFDPQQSENMVIDVTVRVILLKESKDTVVIMPKSKRYIH
jgi:hypothetical protein